MDNFLVKEYAKEMLSTDLWKSYESVAKGNEMFKTNSRPTRMVNSKGHKIALEFGLSNDNKNVVVMESNVLSGAKKEIAKYSFDELKETKEVKKETSKKVVKEEKSKTTKKATTKKPAKEEKPKAANKTTTKKSTKKTK